MATKKLKGVPAVKHDTERLQSLKRFLDIPKDENGYRRSDRFDGINHWGDLLECQDLLEHIVWQQQKIAKYEEAVEAVRVMHGKSEKESSVHPCEASHAVNCALCDTLRELEKADEI